MSACPKVVLDTSAINEIKNRSTEFGPLTSALNCGFEILLPTMSVDELLSHPDAKNRDGLFAICQRLLASGCCIQPPHEILSTLILEYFANPSTFNWSKISIRAQMYEAAIISRDFPESVCSQQREEQFEMERHWDKAWRNLRPKLNSILAQDPSKRPTTFEEAAVIAKRDGGFLWGTGCELCRHVTGEMPSEQTIRAFTEICSPFRAACYGLVNAWYHGSLKSPDGTSPAGRNDLMMAAYLPFCERFLSDDWGQRRSLREVAAEADVDCEVLSCGDLNASLIVPV